MNLKQNHNQHIQQKDPNMKNQSDTAAVAQRTATVQAWIEAAMKDDPRLEYLEAWQQAEKEPALADVFKAMSHSSASGNSDGVTVGAHAGADMSAKSVAKQPNPRSRGKDGYPSGFAAGPAINMMRGGTGNQIGQFAG